MLAGTSLHPSPISDSGRVRKDTIRRMCVLLTSTAMMGGLFGTSGLRDQVYFARIYGEAADFGELGRQDYVFIEKDTSDKNLGPMYRIHVWKSKGAGGAKIKGM